LLWAKFATTLRASLQWLLARPVFAALLGSVTGPLSYGAAARLGAAVIHEPATFQYAVLAIVWAGTIAFLAAVSRWSVATLARRSVAAGPLVLPGALPATAARKVEVAGVTFPLSKACIPGADFARAYFSIWLGPQPISDDLKQALLGQP
jgi:hypothetical protein